MLFCNFSSACGFKSQHLKREASVFLQLFSCRKVSELTHGKNQKKWRQSERKNKSERERDRNWRKQITRGVQQTSVSPAQMLRVNDFLVRSPLWYVFKKKLCVGSHCCCSWCLWCAELGERKRAEASRPPRRIRRGGDRLAFPLQSAFLS